jgi:hypothetical protein
MKLLLENWREYIKEEDEFQPPTQEAVDDDIDKYLEDLGLSRDEVKIEKDKIGKDKKEIKNFADKARELPGNITDKMVTDIGNDGKIKKPVILNKDTDEIIDGKHRFIAAEEYGLDLPVVYISAKEAQ